MIKAIIADAPHMAQPMIGYSKKKGFILHLTYLVGEVT